MGGHGHVFYLCSAGKCKEIRSVVGRHYCLFPFLPSSSLLTQILLDGYRKGHCLRRGHSAHAGSGSPCGYCRDAPYHTPQTAKMKTMAACLLHAGILAPGMVSQPEWAAKEKYLLNEWKQHMMYDCKGGVSFPQSGNWYLMASLMRISCAHRLWSGAPDKVSAAQSSLLLALPFCKVYIHVWKYFSFERSEDISKNHSWRGLWENFGSMPVFVLRPLIPYMEESSCDPCLGINRHFLCVELVKKKKTISDCSLLRVYCRVGSWQAVLYYCPLQTFLAMGPPQKKSSTLSFLVVVSVHACHTSSWGHSEAHAWALGCAEQIWDKGADVLISAGFSSCILGKCRWPPVQHTMFLFSFPSCCTWCLAWTQSLAFRFRNFFSSSLGSNCLETALLSKT